MINIVQHDYDLCHPPPLSGTSCPLYRFSFILTLTISAAGGSATIRWGLLCEENIEYLLTFLPLLCYKISTANLGERWAVESRGSDPRSGNDREESVGFRLGINKVGLGWGQGWSLDNVGDWYQGSRIWWTRGEGHPKCWFIGMIFTNRIRSTLDGGLVWMMEVVLSAPDGHHDVKEEILNCKM